MSETDISFDDLIEEFVSITKCTRERARECLESNSWLLDNALANYFEQVGGFGNQNVVPNETERIKEEVLKTKTSSNVRTLSSIRSDSLFSDDEAYFAGGSVHSGQQILGSDQGESGNQLATSLKQAANKQVFIKTTESSSSQNSTGIPESSNPEENYTSDPQQPKDSPTKVFVILYQNGFRIIGGPFRPYTDSQCSELINSINMGEFPESLLPGRASGSVHLSVSDKRSEKYSPRLVERQPFSGQGYILGTTLSDVIPETSQAEQNNFDFSSGLDQRTNLKIRLPDGSTLEFTIDKTTTIEEIKNFIKKVRPQLQDTSFSIVSTFPTLEVDVEQTVERASLLNSCVLVKLIQPVP